MSFHFELSLTLPSKLTVLLLTQNHLNMIISFPWIFFPFTLLRSSYCHKSLWDRSFYPPREGAVGQYLKYFRRTFVHPKSQEDTYLKPSQALLSAWVWGHTIKILRIFRYVSCVSLWLKIFRGPNRGVMATPQIKNLSWHILLITP